MIHKNVAVRVDDKIYVVSFEIAPAEPDVGLPSDYIELHSVNSAVSDCTEAAIIETLYQLYVDEE